MKSETRVSGQGIIFSLGYPLLFHWLVLAVVLGLLLIAAVQHIVPLLAFTVFFLVLAIVSWLWSWQSLRAVSHQLTLSQSRAFPGEQIDLNISVTNGKRLFLPWLEIEAELPYRLVTGKLAKVSPYSRERRRWVTSISGGQQVRWEHRLECKARGDYRLGPVRIRSGDIFGIFPREMIMPCFEPLLVYPRIVPVDKLSLPQMELLGDRGAPKNIYEDTSRTMGARDYRYDDPFKRIHWKASARHHQLRARQYESTTSLNLLMVLDVDSFCQPETGNEESFELAVTTVASLACEAQRERFPVGLMANSIPEIDISIRSGREQLLLLLEALARIQAKSRLPLDKHLDKNRVSLPAGVTLVIVTHVLLPPLVSVAQKLHQEGHSLLVLSVGKPPLIQHINGIPVVSIQSINDLSRGYAEARS